MITADQLRQKFLDYFAQNGHQIVTSSSLVPKDDPSLLFTNAGMVQFKRVFLGQEKRSYSRAVSSQKCLRVGGKHNDLENVGRTARHHTFFEMLGNFSFGDYFKEEAIRYGWEFLTQELGLDKNRLYASVYEDDDEAFELWKKIAGLPEKRIYRLGGKDNFWSMGDTGPCGPCSEILIDQGEHMACGPDCEIGVCECDRYLEIWNLVFMQFDRDEQGVMHDLPKPSIDTGMGLERIAAVCQGVYSNFDTDLFSGLIAKTCQKAGVEYGQDHDTDTALRVIADHSRAVPFMISDGILPSNEGRGYVLRRLIRRAYRFGRFLGLQEPFLFQICEQLVQEMGAAFPELRQSRDFMLKVVHKEEEGFSETLDKGLKLLEEELQNLHEKGEKTLPGEVAFKLYDTFGFPLDIVNDVAGKQDIEVDESGFRELMAEQKNRSKAAWSGSGEVDLGSRFAEQLESGLQTEFVGYDSLQTSSRIVSMLGMQGENCTQVGEKEEAYVLTAKTVFYGEAGGQVGDQGRMLSLSGTARVLDTIKPAPELTVHRVQVEKGSISLDQEVELIVDEGNRVATARNHTCTHLLHTALRRVLGEHVNQAGSLVAPDRLRFDFTHISPMSKEELREVEDEVNRVILADIELKSEIMSYDKALEEGAVALFGEKYADEVRTVEVPGESKELCGGTHLRSTGQAGSFYILSETAISSGVRRIEAATGWNAVHRTREQSEELSAIAGLLKSRPGELSQRIKELQSQLKKAQKEKEALEGKLFSDKGKDVLQQVKEISGIPVLAVKVDAPDVKSLRNMMDDLRSKQQQGIILLGAKQENKAMLLLYVSKDLHERFTAPGLIKEVAKEVKGSGGGRPDLAQAGGGDPSGIDKALSKLEELLQAG